MYAYVTISIYLSSISISPISNLIYPSIYLSRDREIDIDICGSQLGENSISRGHLAISGDIFYFTTWMGSTTDI